MKKFGLYIWYALVGAVATQIATVACTNGKLDSHVAPIVSSVATVACELIPILDAQGTEAGEVCADVSKLLAGVLAGLSAPPSTRRAAGLDSRLPVYMSGRVVGYFRQPYVGEVQAKLDALQADAGAR